MKIWTSNLFQKLEQAKKKENLKTRRGHFYASWVQEQQRLLLLFRKEQPVIWCVKEKLYYASYTEIMNKNAPTLTEPP